MEKTKSFYSKHRYMLGFFFTILLAQYIGNFEQIYDPESVVYTYHIVDFRFGYVSKVIQGQIFQWFFHEPTMQNIKAVSLCLFVLIALCASYFLEKVCNSAPQENKMIILYLIIIFCISGSTFHIFYRQLGMLDVYWVYAFVLFLIFLQNKKTWFLIPLAYAFMISVHYGALLCYIPLMSIILLYKAANSRKKDEKKLLLIVFVSSVIIAFCALAFFAYNEKYNLNLTQEELHNYFNSRGTNEYFYYDYAFFRDFSSEIPGVTKKTEEFSIINSSLVPSAFKPLIKDIDTAIFYHISIHKNVEDFTENSIFMIVLLMLSGAPALKFIYSFLRKSYFSFENKLKRFCLFCAMAIFPFAFLTSLLFSYDYARWFAHAFMCCFICFFVIVYFEGENCSLMIKNNIISKPQKVVYLMYLMVCFLVRFNPYRPII